MTKFKINLKPKCFLLLSILIPFLFITQQLLLGDKKNIENQICFESLLKAQENKSIVEEYLNGKIKILKYWTSTYDFKNKDYEKINFYLNYFIEHCPENDIIFLNDEEGSIVSYFSKDNQQNKMVRENIDFIKNKLPFNSLKEGIILTKVGEDPSFILISIPWYDKSDKVIGIVYLAFETENLNKLLETDNLYSSFITDDKGLILASNNTEFQNEKFAELQSILKTEKNIAITESPRDGRKKIYSYLPIKNSNWLIINTQPYSVVKNKLFFLKFKSIGISLLIFIISYLFLYFYLKIQNKNKFINLLERERLNSITELAACFAHELRNPLVAIKGFIQLEKYKKNSTLGQEKLNLILDEISTIETLINDFLKLSQESNYEIKEFNLADIVTDVYNFKSIMAEIRNSTITLNISSDNIKMQGDPKLIHQLIINLIQNSLEAITEKGEIRIKLTKENNWAKLVIWDNGVGIPDKVLRKIGKPFNTTKHHKTGLGLAICEKIIKFHDGHWKITSNKNVGTSIAINLPLKYDFKKNRAT